MERPVNINKIIFEQVRESIEIGFPSVYAHTDNGRRIVTPEFIERIIRAYPYASASMGNIPFEPSLATSEHNRMWSSAFLSAIRDQLPEYADRYNVSGIGYKYRDVIWRVCLIIYDRQSERNYRNLLRCMELTDNPASVYFLSQDEIDIYNARPQPIIPAEEPSVPVPSRESGTDVLPILIFGGLALAAILLLSDE